MGVTVGDDDTPATVEADGENNAAVVDSDYRPLAGEGIGAVAEGREGGSGGMTLLELVAKWPHQYLGNCESGTTIHSVTCLRCQVEKWAADALAQARINDETACLDGGSFERDLMEVLGKGGSDGGK